MNMLEIMGARHSVRQYLDRPIQPEHRKVLDSYSEELNRESGLHIQIIYDEPECFNSRMAHYGKFENANNYIALVGLKGSDLSEKEAILISLGEVEAKTVGMGPCLKIDLGIVKCHFELGAGKENFAWKQAPGL